MKLIKILKIIPLLVLLFVLSPMRAIASDAASIAALSAITTIDGNEILVAVQAINKSTTADITDFANMMLKDHGKNLADAFGLANKIHALPLNPNPNGMHDK